jgi:hypothetical protein
VKMRVEVEVKAKQREREDQRYEQAASCKQDGRECECV